MDDDASQISRPIELGRVHGGQVRHGESYDWRSAAVAAAGVTIGALPLLMMRWRFNALSMGEDEARALGVDSARERALLIAGADVGVLTIRERAQRVALVPQDHTEPFAYPVEDVILTGRSAHLDPFAAPSRGVTALQFCDHIVMLHCGTILADGAPGDVMTGENLSRLYGLEVKTCFVDGWSVAMVESMIT